MSGTNLPVRLEAVGQKEVEAALESIRTAGTRAFEAVEQSTGGAGVALGGFQQKLGLATRGVAELAQVVPGLAPLSGALELASQHLDGLTRAAERAGPHVSRLLETLGGLSGVGRLALGSGAVLLATVLAATRLGEAAQTTDRSMQAWNITLDATGRGLERVATAALAAANAERLQRLGVVQAAYGNLIEGGGGQAVAATGRARSQAETALADAERRAAEIQARLDGANPTQAAVIQPRLDWQTSRVAAARQELTRLQAQEATENAAFTERRDALARGVAVLSAPIVYSDPAGPNAPDRPTGGRAARPDEDPASIVQAGLDRLRDTNRQRGEAIEATLMPAVAALTRYNDALRDIQNSDLEEARQAELRTLAQSRYNEELAKGEGAVTKFGTASAAAFSKAFEGMVSSIQAGEDLGEVLDALQDDLARVILQAGVAQPLQAATAPLFSAGSAAVGDFVKGLFAPSANGNAFDSSGLIPFAKGGVVTRPTVFPFANGTGLMGEAGPEAILPLQRGADGKLGVQSQGGGGVTFIGAPITIDARGADAGVEAKIRAGVSFAIQESQRQFLNEIQRGGTAAKITGRRR